MIACKIICVSYIGSANKVYSQIKKCHSHLSTIHFIIYPDKVSNTYGTRGISGGDMKDQFEFFCELLVSVGTFFRLYWL